MEEETFEYIIFGTFEYIIVGIKSDEDKEPEGTDDIIPTGWTLQTEEQNDGSKKEIYSCSLTGQEFYSRADFTRYVKYAMDNNVGMFALANKSVKRERHVKNNSTATKPRNRTSVATLSLRKKPSSASSNLVTAEQRNDSNSKYSSSSESANEEKDEDYVPELVGDDADEPDIIDVDCLSEDMRRQPKTDNSIRR